MARLNGCFFDTSVLIGGIIELGRVAEPAHELMKAIAEERLLEPLTAWHCCLEFYSVTTRLPMELRLSPEEAALLVTEEILGRFQVHELPSAGRRDLLDAAVAERVAGGRVYDAHIAEVARRAGAETVVTDNRRHFTSLLRYGIRVLRAAELVEELPAS